MNENTMPNSASFRVRYAPSPTGHQHIGGARTALYDYLMAKKTGGTFLLRIEDTDLDRSTKEYEEKTLEILQWLGLKWDEGPFRQSDRLDIYLQKAEELIQQHKAYRCFCSEETLEKKRQHSLEEGFAGHYDQTCLKLSQKEIEEQLKQKIPYVIRFKNPQKLVSFTDLIRQDVSFPPDMIGDFVILRSNGMPVYNFCCVVDDALMNITHVIRAEEHLPNTLRQILLYEALEYPIPFFAHVSIIVGQDRQKLSKRHGGVSVEFFREQGFCPEGILNYLCLLGWTHPQEKEIFSLEEILPLFTLESLTKSAAAFDLEKFRWANGQHLKNFSKQELRTRLLQWSQQYKTNLFHHHECQQSSWWQELFISCFQEKCQIFSDFLSFAENIFSLHSFDKEQQDQELQEILSWETTSLLKNALSNSPLLANNTSLFLTQDQSKNLIEEVKNTTGAKGKFLFKGVRALLTRSSSGADLPSILALTPLALLKERLTL